METQHAKVIAHLIRLAKAVTKPKGFGFQVLRRDRDDGTIEYQIFADTKGHGTQIAYVQSTKHDAKFNAACFAQGATIPAPALRAIGTSRQSRDRPRL